MKKTMKLLFIFITCISFHISSFARENRTKQELKDHLENLLDWADHYLMPRSKKDRDHNNIDNETREMVKKIRANCHWLRGHMIAEINQGWSLDRIRDDYKQEQHYMEIYNLTLEALERTDNSEGEKLNELLERFFERYVVPIGEIVGYHTGSRHRGHGRSRGGFRGRSHDRDY